MCIRRASGLWAALKSRSAVDEIVQTIFLQVGSGSNTQYRQVNQTKLKRQGERLLDKISQMSTTRIEHKMASQLHLIWKERKNIYWKGGNSES